jgi:hypothetical protein
MVKALRSTWAAYREVGIKGREVRSVAANARIADLLMYLPPQS